MKCFVDKLSSSPGKVVNTDPPELDPADADSIGKFQATSTAGSAVGSDQGL